MIMRSLFIALFSIVTLSGLEDWIYVMFIKQYANDTCIIVKARNTTELKFETNALLSRIEQWSSANKFTINMDKTKALIISPKLKETVKNITLSSKNFRIQVVNSFKYLGMILNNK